MNSKAVGESSEAQVLAAFLKAGKVVLMPFGDNQRYDLVVDESGELFRFQVKTARSLRNGSIGFNTSSMTTEKGVRKQVPYKGQIEFFAVYHPATEQIFIVPVAEAGKRNFSIRLNKSKHNGIPGNPADKYIFQPSISFSR